MTAFAMDHAEKGVHPTGGGPGAQADYAHRIVGIHMLGKDHLNPLYGAILEHAVRAAEAFVIGYFLGRLEEQAHRPWEGFVFQQGSYTQTHGCMGIMTACVHNPFDLGGVRAVVGLLDWQSIHVCADGNYRRPLAQLADNAGTTHPGTHAPTQGSQSFSDASGSAMLIEAQFRMHVKVAPPVY